MSAGTYVVGVLLAALDVGAVLAGARRLRARLLPGASGAGAWTADGVLVVALLVAVCEAAGIIGVLDRAGTTVGCLLAGVGAWAAGDHAPPPTSPPTPPPTPDPTPPPPATATAPRLRLGAATLVAIVAAPWIGWTAYAYRHGMQTVDTLWYHLPFAARFVQLGNIWHLQYFDRDPVTVFYPANSELLHALGLVWWHSDLLSPLLNLGWGALALSAAWAIGRRFHRELGCLLATLIVLGTPGLVDTQPGGAYNDVACIALLLAAAAFLLGVTPAAADDEGEGSLSAPSLGASALAALASGLALGTKFTMIAPALTLAVGAVAVAQRGARARHAAVWLGALVALGGYWYARNWVAAGNPLPSLAIHLGPLSLPAPHVFTPTFTVAQYLTSGHVWRVFYVPGLRRSLGLVWWALLAGGAIGAVAALVRGPGTALRMLGGLAIVSAVAFLLTPQFLGLPGAPFFFVANVRYAATPLVLGLVLLAVCAPGRPRHAPAILLGALGLMLVFTEIDPGVWPTGLHLNPFGAPISGAAAWVGVAGAALIPAAVAMHGRGRGPARTAALSAAIVALVGGWALARSYTTHRYTATEPLPRIYAWAQRQHHARIGIVGLDVQYPLFGADASNYVQYIGATQPHAGFGAIPDCAQWRAAVDRGHYTWVLVTPFGFPLGSAHDVAPEAAWTASSPAAVPALRETNGQGEAAVLFRIRGTLDPDTC